ncbi:MAG: hypothetical protein ACD_28C00108G0031 [uncultured bacterium]|nr:MAG: hypothetical protein ACD_28C00108G0031 [uncultured bacterium]KKT75390.1 MAG: hypothetical protein UW70_C0035G0011 [Candidatus Peregrinibacteria bacterium GW2011_GWA2_44_7]
MTLSEQDSADLQRHRISEHSLPLHRRITQGLLRKLGEQVEEAPGDYRLEGALREIFDNLRFRLWRFSDGELGALDTIKAAAVLLGLDEQGHHRYGPVMEHPELLEATKQFVAAVKDVYGKHSAKF